MRPSPAAAVANRTANRHRTASRLAGVVAVTGLTAISAYQIALAVGAPLGGAAWGGSHTGRLPADLRVASAVSFALWVAAAVTIAARVRQPASRVASAASRWGNWVVVAKLSLGTMRRRCVAASRERLDPGPR